MWFNVLDNKFRQSCTFEIWRKEIMCETPTYY